MATRYIGHLPDGELVQRAQRGDDAAANALIERYGRFARAKCRGYFIVGGDADDLEQEALIGLYKAVRDYRSERGGSLRTFIELCVTRQIITAIKCATRQKHVPLNRSVPLATAQSPRTAHITVEDVLVDQRTPGPAEVVVSAEAVAEMEETLIAVLSDLELQVHRLHRAGNSSVEIGEALGKDNKAIDNAFQRIRRKYERLLQTASSTSS